MLSVRLRRALGAFALDLAFEAPTPGVVALLGRSGSGKSTAVNLLAGLLAADSGRIELDGEVLLDTDAGIAVPAERRRIGYVFQDGRLFPHLDVLANLRYGERRARSGASAGQSAPIGIDEIVALLDLAPLLARGTQRLSGGERQRVALGRALLAQPRLLLLDEPLAALDAARREEVLPYLASLRDRLAIPMVYVTHQFEEALHLATHLVLLEHGKAIAAGALGPMSLRPELRGLVGAEQVGAVFDGTAASCDAANGMIQVEFGSGHLRLHAPGVARGARVRLQLLARDVILATQAPVGLSVRNQLAGTIVTITPDDAGADLVAVDVGGPQVLARITQLATRELGLRAGAPVLVLIKAASMRGHSYAAPLR